MEPWMKQLLLDETTTVEEWLSNDDGGVRPRLERLVNYAAGNVRSTDQYWASTLRKFEATSLFQSHIMGRESTIFHTLSMAKYHDPFLRRLLSKYVTKVVSPNAGAQVFDDDKAFHEAVSKYKQVVTQIKHVLLLVPFLLNKTKL
jgi:hypothetical protein